MLFGPQQSIATANGAYAVTTDGVNVWVAWCTAGVVQVLKSTNQGYDFPAVGSSVTVNNNAANSEVMLNEPFVRDPVTGRLHLCWERRVDDAGNPCALMTSHSDDGGATWSAAITLDDGVAYGNNRFYRLGVLAYNGVVEVVYTTELNGTFTTNGLWSVKSTDGGATFTAAAKLYTVGVVCPFEPNATIGDDGTAHISWYDPLVASNTGGDIYYAKGTWNASGFQWQAAITQVTTGQSMGRVRISASRGVVMCCANGKWPGGPSIDVRTVRSTDNGDTWGAVVIQAAPTGAGNTTHPWLNLDSISGVLFWCDTSPNPSPSTYGFRVSTDGGATWANGATPMTTTLANADAPKIINTNDLIWTFGSDSGSNAIFAPLPVFSPAPAIAPIVDSFTRANENPLSGSGTWAQSSTAGTALKLVSNQTQRQAAAGVFGRSGSFRNNLTVAAGESYVTIGDNGGADGELDLYLLEQATKNGYGVLAKNNLGSTAIFLGRFDAGAFTQLATTAAFGAVTGDKYNLRLTPNDVVVHRFVGTSSDWEELFRERDTTYRNNTLRVALDLIGLNGEPADDDVGAGTLLAPSNSVAPVTSGTTTLSVTNGTWSTAQGATPARYAYQWQSSPAGAASWSNISLAALAFYAVTDATKDYRCVVTASNSYGTATANSNTISASGPVLQLQTLQSTSGVFGGP